LSLILHYARRVHMIVECQWNHRSLLHNFYYTVVKVFSKNQVFKLALCNDWNTMSWVAGDFVQNTNVLFRSIHIRTFICNYNELCFAQKSKLLFSLSFALKFRIIIICFERVRREIWLLCICQHFRTRGKPIFTTSIPTSFETYTYNIPKYVFFQHWTHKIK